MFVVQTINLHSCTAQSLMVISAISTTIMCVVESPMVFRELQPQSVQHFTKLKQPSPLVVETRQRLIPLTEWNGFYFRFSHECFFAVYHIYPYLIYAHALSAARWLQCGVFLFFFIHVLAGSFLTLGCIFWWIGPVATLHKGAPAAGMSFLQPVAFWSCNLLAGDYGETTWMYEWCMYNIV